MPFVRANGIVLHYRLDGQPGAPAVALVNSLGTDARIWDEVIAVLATRYRVLSYDKRGHGLSDAPAGDYALADHVADLVDLLDHAGMSTAAVAGVSVGGLIAQGFALRYPDRLKALVLCDTAPKLGEPQSWNDRITAIRGRGMGAIADAVMERWFSAGFRQNRPVALAGWRNLFLRTDVEGYCGTCATLRDTDITAEIGSIDKPTLVLVGDEDGSTPVPLVRACAEAIPGARFEIIAQAGHIPSIEQPATVAALMTEFFKEAGHG